MDTNHGHTNGGWCPHGRTVEETVTCITRDAREAILSNLCLKKGFRRHQLTKDHGLQLCRRGAGLPAEAYHVEHRRQHVTQDGGRGRSRRIPREEPVINVGGGIMGGSRSTMGVYTTTSTCLPREACRGSVECLRDTSARRKFFVESAGYVFAAEGDGNFVTAPRTKRRLGQKPCQARVTGWNKEHRDSTRWGCTHLPIVPIESSRH